MLEKLLLKDYATSSDVELDFIAQMTEVCIIVALEKIKVASSSHFHRLYIL